MLQIFSETITDMDETGLLAQIAAVIICDAGMQKNVTMAAGNDSDWLIAELLAARRAAKRSPILIMRKKRKPMS